MAIPGNTWSSTPGSGDWNTAANWSPAGVPEGTSANAFFGTSAVTTLSLSADVSVGSIQYNSGASSFLINTGANSLALDGAGIIDNSSSTQSFDVNGQMIFNNSASAGDVGITNYGQVQFNNSSSAGSAGVISTLGASVIFSGTATGNNAAFILDGATLDLSGMTTSLTLGSVSDTGGAPGSIYLGANNLSTGNLNDNDTFYGIISGSGSLTKVGTGVLTLEGANNYMGGTNIDGGTLEVEPGGSLGTGPVANNAGALLDFYGNVSAGSVVLTNNSIVNFDGFSNSQISTAGSSTLDNPDNAGAQLYFVNYASAGSASIYNGLADFVVFNGNSSASNATLVNRGALTFTGDGTGVNFATAGNADINQDNGQLVFEDYSTAANSSIVVNGGSLVFAENATAQNASIGLADNAGVTLSFFNNANAGSAGIYDGLGDAVSFGGLSSAADSVMDINGKLDFTGQSEGVTAQVTLESAGVMDISGETSGTPVTIGSLLGSGSVSLGANDLTVGSNNIGTVFTGTIADGGSGGSLTKVGMNGLILYGANNYSGGTAVTGGTLFVENSSALGTGSVTVSNGFLVVGGPFAVNIGGNYSQSSEGNLRLGVDGAAAGLWDQLDITGPAALAGTLQLESYNGFHVASGETFVLVDSGAGLSGQFGLIENFLSEPISVTYTAHEMLVEALSFAQLGLTPNQKAVGAALDNLSLNSEDSNLTNTLATRPLSSLPGEYNQLSPSNLTPMFKMNFSAAHVEAGLIGDRLSQIWGRSESGSSTTAWNNGGVMFAGNLPAMEEAQISQKDQPQDWGAFAVGLGDFGTVTSDGNGAGYQYSTGGTMAGMDYRFAKDLAGGLMLGYAQSGSSQSTGTVSVTGGQLGVYAGLKEDELHLNALFDAGLDNYSTQRQAMGGTANGSPSGLEWTGQVNAGFDWIMGSFLINPFVSGQYTQVSVNGFTETGSQGPLTFPAQSEGYLASDLGASISRDWPIGGIQFSPNLSAAWEHVYEGSEDSLTANFGTGSNFTVSGPATGTDAAVLGAGLNAEFAKGFNLFASYQGKVGMTNISEQSISGGINIGF